MIEQVDINATYWYSFCYFVAVDSVLTAIWFDHGTFELFIFSWYIPYLAPLSRLGCPSLYFNWALRMPILFQ